MEEIKDIPVIGIVLPCYNEQEVLNDSFLKIETLLKQMQANQLVDSKSFIVFVDDGSKDKTWEIIETLRRKHLNVRGVKLSKNFGHQSAILAGMFSFTDFCDCIITIDADLQDDIDVIPKMVLNFKEGAEIVYGVRKSRPNDSFFKKHTALGFYKFMQKLGVDVINNHADFRLASKKVILELSRYKEVNLFLRGVFPTLGFRSTEVYYDRKSRLAGETKYPLSKMLSFALNGITSFSVRPLRIITVSGILFFIVSIGLIIYALLSYFSIHVVPGWASIVIPVYFIGGIQLLSIGIIGEYLGKIYKEVKGRPLYIVESFI